MNFILYQVVRVCAERYYSKIEKKKCNSVKFILYQVVRVCTEQY